MNCTLLIADLLPPAELGTELLANLRTPYLNKLLARGSTVLNRPMMAEDWLCEGFGVERQQDRPLAALMLKADGGDPQQDYWLCAEPVQLRVDRNRLIVAARVNDYTAEETGVLVAALNAHFNADGLEFLAPAAARWYVRSRNIPALTTTPLTQALNRSVKHHLPQGADALAWHRVMNEAQMILHTHTVNAARDANGAIVANSVWLWGGGTLPETSRARYTDAWGGGAVVRALAAGSGAAHHELPKNGGEWRAAGSAHAHLLVFDEPANALREGNAAAWQAQITALDSQWIAPMLHALSSQSIATLRLIGCNRDNQLDATATRGDLRRFWRRTSGLQNYAARE
jgi:hypothetical protein